MDIEEEGSRKIDKVKGRRNKEGKKMDKKGKTVKREGRGREG